MSTSVKEMFSACNWPAAVIPPKPPPTITTCTPLASMETWDPISSRPCRDRRRDHLGVRGSSRLGGQGSAHSKKGLKCRDVTFLIYVIIKVLIVKSEFQRHRGIIVPPHRPTTQFHSPLHPCYQVDMNPSEVFCVPTIVIVSAHIKLSCSFPTQYVCSLVNIT